MKSQLILYICGRLLETYRCCYQCWLNCWCNGIVSGVNGGDGGGGVGGVDKKVSV